MKFISTIQKYGTEIIQESSSIEDAKVWISLMCPDMFNSIDWDKLEKDEVIEIPNKIIIEMSKDVRIA